VEQGGFTPIVWRDDTEAALEWFRATTANPPQNGLSLAVVMGQEMREMTSNLARNLREDRLGVLFAVLSRD
jgi:hypothetical protein